MRGSQCSDAGAAGCNQGRPSKGGHPPDAGHRLGVPHPGHTALAVACCSTSVARAWCTGKHVIRPIRPISQSACTVVLYAVVMVARHRLLNRAKHLSCFQKLSFTALERSSRIPPALHDRCECVGLGLCLMQLLQGLTWHPCGRPPRWRPRCGGSPGSTAGSPASTEHAHPSRTAPCRSTPAPACTQPTNFTAAAILLLRPQAVPRLVQCQAAIVHYAGPALCGILRCWCFLPGLLRLRLTQPDRVVQGRNQHLRSAW